MTNARNILSALLVLLGAALLLAGAAAAYGRVQVLEREAFAERGLEALEGDGVRGAIEEEIVDALTDRARSLGIVGRRSEIRPIIEAVITSPPFRRKFREAALEFHRVSFEAEGDAARFDLRAVSPLLEDELQSYSPEVARMVSRRIDLELLTIRRTRLAGEALAEADRLRTLGIVLPLLAAAAFMGAVALARPHRRGLLHVGLAMVLVGAVLAAAVPLVRTLSIDRLDQTSALTAFQVRDAARDIYDAYLGDLLTWGLVLALAGLALTAAALAAAWLRPVSRAAP